MSSIAGTTSYPHNRRDKMVPSANIALDGNCDAFQHSLIVLLWCHFTSLTNFHTGIFAVTDSSLLLFFALINID